MAFTSEMLREKCQVLSCAVTLSPPPSFRTGDEDYDEDEDDLLKIQYYFQINLYLIESSKCVCVRVLKPPVHKINHSLSSVIF